MIGFIENDKCKKLAGVLAFVLYFAAVEVVAILV